MWQGLEQTGAVCDAVLQKAADRADERVAHVCRSATAEVRPPQFGWPLSFAKLVARDDLSPASDSGFRRRGFTHQSTHPEDIVALAVPDFPKKSECSLISGNGCGCQ